AWRCAGWCFRLGCRRSVELGCDSCYAVSLTSRGCPQRSGHDPPPASRGRRQKTGTRRRSVFDPGSPALDGQGGLDGGFRGGSLVPGLLVPTAEDAAFVALSGQQDGVGPLGPGHGMVDARLAVDHTAVIGAVPPADGVGAGRDLVEDRLRVLV